MCLVFSVVSGGFGHLLGWWGGVGAGIAQVLNGFVLASCFLGSQGLLGVMCTKCFQAQYFLAFMCSKAPDLSNFACHYTMNPV